MKNKSEWQRFFDGHAPVYMDNVFTKNTMAEVDFIIEELQLEKGNSLLDVGCGTGRHSVELAKRGLNVTGIDLSSGMLDQARKVAVEANVEVELLQADATRFEVGKQYDAAICVCEGAFGLLGSDDDPAEHDLAILCNIHRALKPGGKFILTALNGFRHIRQYSNKDVAENRLDPHYMIERSEMEYDSSDGKKTVTVSERGFAPSELALMCRVAGFEIDYLGGGTAGNWGKRVLDLDEYEIMVIARKV